MLEYGERVMGYLPVRLTLFILMLAILYGFTRIHRVEQLADFLTCGELARIHRVDPRPCLSHLQRPEEFLGGQRPEEYLGANHDR